jgi:hypothetical protein
MKYKNLLVLFFLFALVLIFYSKSVNAALLGVNRASLNYEDVLRGGYAEEQIIITMGSLNNIQVFFEARGDVADWIRFEPEDDFLVVNENNPGILNIIVEPPSDVRVDNYEGVILISTGALGNVSSQMGTNIVVAFEVKININITDTQIISCTAGGISISDVEIGESNLIIANIKNSGNVRIRPSFDINIYSKMQDNLLKSSSYRHDFEIIPTKTQAVQGLINLALEPGQYWAEITEPVCGTTSLVTFSVLERGGISDLGELLRIRTSTWASTNEIIPISASFKNSGSRIVSAQFKGVISKDGKIVEVIESDVVNIAPGEEFDFEMFYTASDIGQYRVSGRVHYNNKVTFERGTIINVNEEGVAVSNSSGVDSVTLFFSIVIVVMTLLIFLILRKEKKKKKRKK